MKKLEDYKKDLDRDLIECKDRIEKINNNIKVANNLIELELHELKIEFYKALCDDSKLIKITITNEKFERILGGDGRSQPWSEWTEGSVCLIESKCYLGNDYDTNGFIKFAEKTLKANNIDKTVIKYI
jgi:hypothetical protein